MPAASTACWTKAKVRQVVQQVIAAKPRGYFAILSHFQRLVKLDLDRRTARVESPVPLAEPQQASIQANLTRRYGEGLIFAFTQNPGLIGGLRVQVGSDVFDGSVQARLAELESQFLDPFCNSINSYEFNPAGN